MFRITNALSKAFKKATETPAHLKGKTNQQIVEEIHHAFYTSAEQMVADRSNDLTLDDERKIEKARRLGHLGFGVSSDLINSLNKSHASKQHARFEEAVNYFKLKYPLYKLITIESVERICKDYGLVYSSVKNYIGSVPDRNLEEMERFKVNEEDAGWCRIFLDSRTGVTHETLCDHSKVRKEFFIYQGFRPEPLHIAAPAKDFNQKGLELSRVKLVPKVVVEDPIVLQPVYYNGVRHFLIVTAWGPEASDSDIVNEIYN